MNKVIAYLVVTLIVFCCDKTNDVASEEISGKNGNYWDIAYIQNSQEIEPSHGYFFKGDGTFYSYHYYDSNKRTPFIYGLSHSKADTTIAANLRKWFITNDSLYIDFMKFKIQYLRNDTLSLETGIETNPIIKLYKVPLTD